MLFHEFYNSYQPGPITRLMGISFEKVDITSHEISTGLDLCHVVLWFGEKVVRKLDYGVGE